MVKVLRVKEKREKKKKVMVKGDGEGNRMKGGKKKGGKGGMDKKGKKFGKKGGKYEHHIVCKIEDMIKLECANPDAFEEEFNALLADLSGSTLIFSTALVALL